MAFSDIFTIDLSWQSLTPELVVLLFALLSPLVALWDTDRKGMRQFTLIGLGGAFLITLGSLFEANWSIPGTGIKFTLEYIGLNVKDAYFITEASQLLKALFLGVAFVTVIGMGRPIKEAEKDLGEFYSLLMFATLGMMIVASSRELVTMFIGIEIASMSSYLMAGFKRDGRGAEAGMKYFIVGAISGALTLFAISLLYVMTGTTMLDGIGAELANSTMVLVPVVMLLAGLGFKISSVPFHAWAPDVYDGAPAPIAGFLAGASKAMGFVALFQIFLVSLGSMKADWELIVALIATASMFYGNLVAIQQQSVARMLAYSSIAQAGYILIALAAGSWYALGGGILHLVVNAAMKLGAFLILGALITAGLNGSVDSFKGLGRKAPFLAFAMTIFVLSMAGLPPFGGFVSKFILFSGAIEVGIGQGKEWLIWLAIIAVVNSAISLVYYVRLMRVMFVENQEETETLHIPTSVKLAVLTCLLAVLGIGLYPTHLIDAAMGAAQAMLS
ncbi:MAG: NADH-quinone oxidoreductase subunit N [Thermoplasmatota archaeon]